MESLIIKPRDKAELSFFIELAKRMGANITTTDDLADERLFQAMEKNKYNEKISREQMVNTLQQIIEE